MALIDSPAVFKARCLAVGLTEDEHNALCTKGWSTYATFAFSVPVQAGHTDESSFVTQVVQEVLGDPSHTSAAKLRRLHFESFTLTVADLRRKVDTPEDSKPRKLPPAELADRIGNLQRDIDPLKIEGSLEPSHAFINAVAQVVEDQRLRYIEWSRCTTRSQEVNNMKEDHALKVWQPDDKGTIKEVPKEPEVSAILSTDLEVHQALRRRGVAYALGQLMSFERHERLVASLFQEFQREPPEGFEKVSLKQLAQADREAHLMMAEKTRAGLVPGPND